MKRLLALSALLVFAACTGSTQPITSTDGGPDTDDGGEPTSTCKPCVSAMDCSGEENCAQFQNDSNCVVQCLSDKDCASTDRCLLLQTVNGHTLSACVPENGACGQLPSGTQPVPTDGGTISTSPGGSGNMSGYCGDLAGPSVSNTQCHCGRPGQCAANNCYGGWYCDMVTNKCVSPPSPSTCGGSDGGVTTGGGSDGGVTTGGGSDGGMIGPVTGTIDPHSGGSASNLVFAVVGDTRPANAGDTQGYPTQIINGIYQDIANMANKPSFIIGTGDYMFASNSGGGASQQIQMYMQARALVPNIPFWPAMGNHECTGYTASNCPNFNETPNVQAFMSAMMQPIGESKPYYERTITATDGSWSAKFIFCAANAWDSTQDSWLQQQLQQKTTYTFVIHHEPAHANTAPGINAIESDSSGAGVTLHLVGHTHTWERGSGELIMGNGGAPITGNAPYGYTIFQRRPSDGAIIITAYDYTNNSVYQSFAITPTGQPTQ